MKKIILWVLFLVPLCTFSQFREDFSDGKFTNVPSQSRAVNWTGDVGKFIVNDQLQLQLNAPKETSTAQLRTASTLSTNAYWEFWMKFGFNPSSSNYAKIYLCSDAENLAESYNSAYIRVGHTNKNICLVVNEGSTEKVLITGAKDRLNLATPTLIVKTTISKKGKLELYSKLEGETEFTLEGSCRIETTQQSSHFGIICHYTSTRSAQFFFDDFLSRELTEEENAKIEENEEENNEGEQPGTYDQPAQGDVVFNEVMANPVSGQPEYVELYNRSNKTFQLKDWNFYYGDKPYKILEAVLKPSEYIVLCKTTTTNLFPEGVKTVGVTSFPTLANTGKLLYLESKNGSLVSWFEYSDKMYGNNEKKNGGWSLECIDPLNFSNNASNWTASVANEGNTAGKINSVNASNPDNEHPSIKSIGITENNVIAITFTKPMDKSSLLNMNAYELSDPGYSIVDLQVDYPKASQVSIRLNQMPPQGTMIQIFMNEVRDISGNLPDDANKAVLVGSGIDAEPLDVVLNEIMFNAPAESEEYIEIYNRSEKIIDLRNLSITTRKSDGTLNKAYSLTTNPIVLYPEEYAVVTKNPNAVCSYFTCHESAIMIELSTTPILNNTSGDIVLLNKNNEIIEEFAYNEKMHAEAIKDKKGVALERMDADRETNDSGNWHSASSDSGYGTPGYANSQSQAEHPAGNPDNLSIVYPELSLGSETYELRYHFTAPGNRCRAFLYDTMGRMVNLIANNEMLGTEGKLYWYGKDSSGRKLSSGVYVVYAEVYTTDGKVRKFKMPVVVK